MKNTYIMFGQHHFQRVCKAAQKLETEEIRKTASS